MREQGICRGPVRCHVCPATGGTDPYLDKQSPQFCDLRRWLQLPHQNVRLPICGKAAFRMIKLAKERGCTVIVQFRFNGSF